MTVDAPGTTAPAGSACLFGVDDRDEGSHCITSGVPAATNGLALYPYGFCYVDAQKARFGACASTCWPSGTPDVSATLNGDSTDTDATLPGSGGVCPTSRNGVCDEDLRCAA